MRWKKNQNCYEISNKKHNVKKRLQVYKYTV